MVSVVLMVGWVLLSKTCYYRTPVGGFVKTGRHRSGAYEIAQTRKREKLIGV